MSRTANYRKPLWFVSLAAIALTAVGTLLVVTGSTDNPANAQELRCDDDQVGLLCLRKDTGGTPGTFVIELARDPEILPSAQAVVCERATTTLASNETELIRGGEEVAIPIDCAIRITERAQAGWELVRIDCDYNPDYYDVREEGRSLIILVDRMSQDSINIGPRNDIRCTFVNRPVQQPLNLGGLFSGQPTPLPTAPAPAAVAPATTSPVISPPRTGEAGIR